MQSPGAQGRKLGIFGAGQVTSTLSVHYPHRETGKEDSNRNSLRTATLCLSVLTALYTLTRSLLSCGMGEETHPERTNLGQDTEWERQNLNTGGLTSGPLFLTTRYKPVGAARQRHCFQPSRGSGCTAGLL